MLEVFFQRFLGKLLCQNASKQQRDSLITSILYQRQERLQPYQTRGIAAMPFVADWGEEGKVIEVTTEDFQKYSLQLFGYDYTHPQMQMFREIFKNAKVLYGYRLNSGTTKAKNDYAVAKYGGSRGNALTIVIENDVDTEEIFFILCMKNRSFL